MVNIGFEQQLDLLGYSFDSPSEHVAAWICLPPSSARLQTEGPATQLRTDEETEKKSNHFLQVSAGSSGEGFSEDYVPRRISTRGASKQRKCL